MHRKTNSSRSFSWTIIVMITHQCMVLSVKIYIDIDYSSTRSGKPRVLSTVTREGGIHFPPRNQYSRMAKKLTIYKTNTWSDI